VGWVGEEGAPSRSPRTVIAGTGQGPSALSEDLEVPVAGGRVGGRPGGRVGALRISLCATLGDLGEPALGRATHFTGELLHSMLGSTSRGRTVAPTLPPVAKKKSTTLSDLGATQTFFRITSADFSRLGLPRGFDREPQEYSTCFVVIST